MRESEPPTRDGADAGVFQRAEAAFAAGDFGRLRELLDSRELAPARDPQRSDSERARLAQLRAATSVDGLHLAVLLASLALLLAVAAYYHS